MSTIYTKSLSTDFGGSIKLKQFHEEVVADGGIAPNLTGVTMTADVVDIAFDAALSAGEQTTLDGLISSHTPDVSKPKVQFYTETAQKQTIKTTSYSRSIRFTYPGSDRIGLIDYVSVLTSKDSNMTSYDIRLYDKTNNNVMAEVTGLTNTSDDANDLGTISNIPAGKAILEIHAKRVGGKSNSKIYIDNAIIYHGNQ